MNTLKRHPLLIAAVALVAYRLIWNAWPGEDYYRATHNGRGYFG